MENFDFMPLENIKPLKTSFMKTRIIFFIAISAITTLSFTFASISSTKKAQPEQSVKASSSDPAGGFMAEDQI